MQKTYRDGHAMRKRYGTPRMKRQPTKLNSSTEGQKVPYFSTSFEKSQDKLTLKTWLVKIRHFPWLMILCSIRFHVKKQLLFSKLCRRQPESILIYIWFGSILHQGDCRNTSRCSYMPICLVRKNCTNFDPLEGCLNWRGQTESNSSNTDCLWRDHSRNSNLRSIKTSFYNSCCMSSTNS